MYFKHLFLNWPWQDHSSKLRYTISNVKFPVLSESGIKNRGFYLKKLIWPLNDLENLPEGQGQ